MLSSVMGLWNLRPSCQDSATAQLPGLLVIGGWHLHPFSRDVPCLSICHLMKCGFHFYSYFSLNFPWWVVWWAEGRESWTKGWQTSAICHLMIQTFKLSQGLACKSNSSLRRYPAVLPLGLAGVQGPPCSCQQGRPSDFFRSRAWREVHSLSSVFECTEAFSIFWYNIYSDLEGWDLEDASLDCLFQFCAWEICRPKHGG